jgi:uncharacterized protein (UPF0261 family)
VQTKEITIAIIGTLDTKERELVFLRERIEHQGASALLIDCGVVRDPSLTPEVSSEEIARLGGSTLAALREKGDRGEAVRIMGQGARAKLLELYRGGRVHGAVSAGGSGNTSIAATAMRDLPVGFPKLIVSTVASGDVSPYVGIKDITMMYSVGDIEGLNRLTTLVLNSAAGAIVGMARMEAPRLETRPTVGLTMFGVTTPAAKMIRERLEAHGFEVLVFHATGAGGRAMETLIEQGIIEGVIDLTTTEVADEVVGGVLSAGPERLKAGVARRVPQVIAPGALDMVNFGPKETVPERFQGRNLYVHNPQVTLMRTTPEENARFAEFIARNLSGADPELLSVMIPLRGVSMIDKDGAPFFDPEADRSFREALKEHLAGSVPVIEVDAHINDEAFAEAVVTRFLEHWKENA